MQQPGQHQVMGYDRAITMFSPDGRLLQVEYAKKTVRLGNTAVGINCKDGILLVTDKRIFDKLVVAESIEKIFTIDNHIMTTAAGIIADARVLVERAQQKAQNNKVTFDSPIDTLSVVRDIASLKQMCTQSGGLRPFGVSMLIAGIDENGSSLYLTDPTGSYYEFRAIAIGEGETDVQEELQKHYKPSITINQAVKLAGDSIKKFLGEDFSVERLDAAFIKNDEKVMKRLSNEEIKNLLK